MTSMKKKLKLGIILDNYEIPCWFYEMLKEIITNPNSEIVLIVKNKLEKIEKKKLQKRIIENYKKILFLAYEKLDKNLFKNLNDAFELKNIRDILSINTLETIPSTTALGDKYSDSDIENIAKHNIDIFIKLSSRFLIGDIFKTARLGIWTLIHSDIKTIKGDPSDIWEIIENRNETGSTLQILTKKLNEEIIITNTYTSTHSYSLIKSRKNHYWKSNSLIPSKILELQILGEEIFFNKLRELNVHPQFYSNKKYITPSNEVMILFGLGLILKTIKNKIEKKIFSNQWILLYSLSPNNHISSTLHQFKKIIPPKDREWADPHIIKRNNKYYIFIEELLYKENKGHISLIIMDNKGSWTQPIKVLEKDYHLSYPYLIEDNGDLFMIPESEKNNTIELYKCIDFPLKWELEKVLINNIIAADSTVILRDGIYWLFTSVIKNKYETNHDELFLFSSKSLTTGNWISHPQNPIIRDVRSARPAGKLFTVNNKLYRPSQNCAKHYGHGIKINEVIELNLTSYKERVVDSIFPDWDKKLVSTHTVNSVDKLTVIDAQMKRRKYFN